MKGSYLVQSISCISSILGMQVTAGNQGNIKELHETQQQFPPEGTIGQKGTVVLPRVSEPPLCLPMDESQSSHPLCLPSFGLVSRLAFLPIFPPECMSSSLVTICTISIRLPPSAILQTSGNATPFFYSHILLTQVSSNNSPLPP